VTWPVIILYTVSNYQLLITDLHTVVVVGPVCELSEKSKGHKVGRVLANKNAGKMNTLTPVNSHYASAYTTPCNRIPLPGSLSKVAYFRWSRGLLNVVVPGT